MDWFLHDNGLHHESVKAITSNLSLYAILDIQSDRLCNLITEVIFHKEYSIKL